MHMATGDRLLLVISPFIGLEALKRFLQSSGTCGSLKVVVRWRPGDLLVGVSDVEIYPYLVERGIPLYINSDIHLKLYICESNIAFSTSGNLTLRGFGYSDKPNVEVGTFVELTAEDWGMIYGLIAGSRQVDDSIYQQYKAYLANNPNNDAHVKPYFHLVSDYKAYTIASLPAVESPRKLAEYYLSPASASHSPEMIRRAVHDLVTFKIPSGLGPADFDKSLGESFARTPFVRDFVDLLKAQGSLRFGAVNDWIHHKCEDVPLPYRWEIKENTHIFYDWLQCFFPQVTWDRPKYSQVIYWQE
jgi:hypothetical protein